MRTSRKPLSPDSPMPWGEMRGVRMRDLPITYLDFLLRQAWLVDWPAIYGYVKSRQKEIEAARPAMPKPETLTTFEDYIKWGRR
jgi:hypothetical protein